MKHEEWIKAGKDNSWKMPERSFMVKLPIIRHAICIYYLFIVEIWYALVIPNIGMVRCGYDSWVLYGIWHGLDNTNFVEHS